MGCSFSILGFSRYIYLIKKYIDLSINILVFSRYLYLLIKFKLLADLLVKNYIDLIGSILVFRRYPSLVIIFKLLCCILYMCTMLFAAKLVCVQFMYSTSLEGQARPGSSSCLKW